MISSFHYGQGITELFKVCLLGCSQRMRFEKRYDLGFEIFDRPNAEAVEIFFVIVMTTIHVDFATAEKILQNLQGFQAFGSLSYYELRKHLPSRTRLRILLDRDGKATFSINESCDPACRFQPFLLIVCVHGLSLVFVYTNKCKYRDILRLSSI